MPLSYCHKSNNILVFICDGKNTIGQFLCILSLFVTLVFDFVISTVVLSLGVKTHFFNQGASPYEFILLTSF